MLTVVGWFVAVWLAHAWSASALTLPAVILSRRRVRWHMWELSGLAIPFALWMILLASQLGPPKSMSNFVIEFSLITLAVPIAAFLRIVVGRTFAERLTAGALVLALTVNAAGVYWLVPSLPE